ncbi:MAG: AMP-binding protein, partial [Burkholderiales bacterium]|nr:AMP-binding protein [Burkholderiales bacterium]
MATVLPSANNGVETKALPLSPAQKQLAILAALTDQGSSAYIVSVAIDLQGNFDATAMETAFRRLVQRHDALRACVDVDADVQRIVTNLPFELRRHSVAPADLELALQNSVAQRFDLTRPGAFRVDLFEMDQTHAVLLFAAHHVFIDGQSVQILFEEFADLMKGWGLDQSSDYAKLATKMASAGKSNNDQAHREYWLQKLRGVPDGITLPFARARLPIRRFNGARVSCELNLTSLRRLELKARKRGMSSNMALIAAFSACLRRAGAGQDMVIGIPYSGRDAELEGIPGYCAHLLPLRLNIPAQASTDFVLEEVKQVFLDAIAHANYPLSLLVDDLNLAKDPSRPALVNMTFNVDKLAAVPDFPGTKAQPVSLPIRHARFDLGCNLIDWNEGASIEMDYDSDLYDAKDVKELLSSFVAMIERMSLADQAFDERLALRLPWHVSPSVETDTASPDLLARFRQAVAQNPLAIATQLDAAEMMNRFQLQCHSDQLAHSLLNQITSDGPVVLLLGRTLAFPVAMLAAWKCGRAYLPLDAGLPVGRVLELLQQAHASCVILQESKGSLLTQLLCEALNERNISYVLLSEKFATSDLSNQERGNINAFQDRKNAPEDCAYQLFTSGSTGKPKLVSVPHRAVMHYLDAAIEAFGFSTGLRYAVVSTFAADLGLTAILPALFHSGTLLIVSNAVARDADAFAGLIRQFPIDVLKIVPSHMKALLATRNRVLPVSHLILGGETASPQLLKLLHDCPHECRIFNHFGPTETTIGVMVGEWSGDTAGMRFTQPLGRNRILILDANGNLCAFNETGEIYIGGPGLAIGYVGHERDQSGPFLYKNVDGFEERLYRTGDLAVLRGDGSIKLFGRSDEQIKIRGYRIEPAEIVDALTAQENVAQAVVFLYQPENRHAYLLAYVVPVYPESQCDSMELLSRLSKVLPEYMLPKEILFVDHLPFTANGKLDKAALPKPLATVNNVAQIEGEQQKTPQQMALISLWRELLRLEWIGLRHDFFQCGGDSILAIQMIARLRQSGWIAKASDIYDAPILMDFAEKLLPADAIFVSQKPAEGQCSLLPSQLRLRQMMGQTLPSHYNLSVRLALEHWVTPELLQKAIGKLVHEHDALRLCFDVASEKPDAHFVEAVVPPLLFLSDKENPLLELNQAQASLRPELAQLMVVVWQSRVEDAIAGKAHVVLILHHLISDGVSIQILLDDLRQALLAMRAGRDPDFGYKTRTVQTWAEHLLRQSRQDALSEEAEYWTICTSIPAPELPGRIEMEPVRMRDERQVYANLSVEETALFLHGLPNAGAEDMLIAALVLSLSTLWAEPIAYLELEGHGRQITQSELDI